LQSALAGNLTCGPAARRCRSIAVQPHHV